MDKLLRELLSLHMSTLGDPANAYKLGFRHATSEMKDRHNGTPCEQIRHNDEIKDLEATIDTLMKLIRDNDSVMHWSRELTQADMDLLKQARNWGNPNT